MGKTRFAKSKVIANGLGVIDNDGNEADVFDNVGNLVKEGAVDADAIGDGEVTAGKLAEGSFWTHMMAYTIGLGANHAGDKTTNNYELMANPAATQEVMVIVTVIEEFADNENTQAVMKIGTREHEDDKDDEIMEDDVLADAPVGFQYIWTGDISDTDDIVNLHVTEETDPAATGEVNILVLSRDKPS